MANILFSNAADVVIRDYAVTDKDAVMAIMFQDSLLFFCGSHLVRSGQMSLEDFEAMTRPEIEQSLSSQSAAARAVLLVDGLTAGFVECFKTKEQSIEAILRLAVQQGVQVTEEQLIAAMPMAKRTDAECESFALISSVVVAREFRGKGHGRALLRYAINVIKSRWPELDRVQLNVNEHNDGARKLYESEGFQASSVQPAMMQFMKTVQYEKNI